jgi:hypothetical protein
MNTPSNSAMLNELTTLQSAIKIAAMTRHGKLSITVVEDAFKFICKYGDTIRNNAEKVITLESPSGSS